MAVNSINAGMSPHSAKAKIEYFMNMSDEELLHMSHIQARADKRTRKDLNSTKAMVNAVPLVDSVIATSQVKKAGGIVGFGSLAASLSAFIGRLGMWAFFIGGFNLLDKAFKKVIKKSETLSDMDKNHPLARPLAEIAVMGGTYYAGIKHKNKIINLIPQSIRKATLDEVGNLKDKINKSFMAEKIYDPLLDNFRKFAKNHKNIAKTAKNIKPLVVPAMIIAAIIKSSVSVPDSYNKRVAENFDSLKNQQDCIRALVDMKEKNNDIDF